MYDNKRIIVVTPAGRKRYLEILIRYVKKLLPVIDEYRLWVNTNNTEDIEFMQQLQKDNSEFVRLEYLPADVSVNGNLSICNFFKNCQDENTIYIRFDDDIVLLDDIEHFKDFIKFRINNPQYFIVYANTINNAICSYIHQKNGNIDDNELCGYDCLDKVGWNNGEFAKKIHNKIIKDLKGDISSFRMNNWILHNYERVSINCISWLGEEFKKIDGIIGNDEEEFLSCTKPNSIKMKNIIYGNFICCHYAFYTQREILDNDKTILQGYYDISINYNKN